MVTENGVVDGKERLLAWKDNGKGGKVPLQPEIIKSGENSFKAGNYPPLGKFITLGSL